MGDLIPDWEVLGYTDGGGVGWTRDAPITIGEALDHLDPPIPRRTLARLLTRLEPVGLARIDHGGPAARTYRYSEVVRAHAEWARRKSQDSFL